MDFNPVDKLIVNIVSIGSRIGYVEEGMVEIDGSYSSGDSDGSGGYAFGVFEEE